MRHLTLLVLAMVCVSPAAHAKHSDETPPTSFSAHTLNSMEARVALARIEMGVMDDVQIGTLPWLWAVKLKNVFVKWRALQIGRLSLSVSVGAFWMNLQDFQDDADDVSLSAIPLFTTLTWDLNEAWHFHGRIGGTVVKLAGDDLGSDNNNIEAVADVSTSMFAPAIEWRLSERTALVLEAHIKISEEAGASGVTTQQLDADTILELHGDSSVTLSDEFRGNAVLSAHWSWERFNLKLGMGYGHYNLPTVNLFIDDPIYFPELDMFWRF